MLDLDTYWESVKQFQLLLLSSKLPPSFDPAFSLHDILFFSLVFTPQPLLSQLILNSSPSPSPQPLQLIPPPTSLFINTFTQFLRLRRYTHSTPPTILNHTRFNKRLHQITLFTKTGVIF